MIAKCAGLAAVLSFLIPGLGQIYNGQKVKSLNLVVVQAVNVALMHVLIGFVFYPVVLVYAYRTAERINASSGRTTYPGRVRLCGGVACSGFW